MAWYLTQSCYPISDDPGNNRRLYRTDVYLNASGYNAYSGYSTSGGGSLGGNGFSYTGPSAASLNNSSQVVCTFDAWIYGDANGYNGGVGASAWFQGGGGYSPGYLTASASSGGFDWDRKPAAPSSVTTVVNSDKSITVTSNAVSSPAGTATYYISWSSSTDNSSWGSWSVYTTIPGNGRAYTYGAGTLTPGQYYRFKMYASNSDGSSAEFAQSSGEFLPAGAKRFDGSSWATGSITKRFDGSAWVSCTTAKRFNGTDWINLS